VGKLEEHAAQTMTLQCGRYVIVGFKRSRCSLALGIVQVVTPAPFLFALGVCLEAVRQCEPL
jgi:hypothetical protein